GPLQQAFKKHHALQCGFCTPGFLMTADALLRKSGPLTDAEVRQAVSGNLCRCTGYQNIVDAIVEASGGRVAGMAQHESASASKFIAARVERAEDDELLSGKGVYVDDIDLPGMLHACVVRSVHARAKILRIDTTAAKRATGVVDVITFEDLGAARKLPLTIPHPNLKPLSEFPLAKDQVRYVGEPVAVIVAESRQLAEDAAALVEVDYEVLPACIDIEKALAPDAPRVHEAVDGQRREGVCRSRSRDQSNPARASRRLPCHRDPRHRRAIRSEGGISDDLGVVPGAAPDSPHALAIDGYARAQSPRHRAAGRRRLRAQ